MSASNLPPAVLAAIGQLPNNAAGMQAPVPNGATGPAQADAVLALQAQLAKMEQDLNTLNTRYQGSSREAIRLHQENEALKQRTAAASFVPSNDGAGRADPRKTLEDQGVPTDALTSLIREILGEGLSPIVDAISAPGRVASQYPEYAQHEREVMSHLNSTPELKARFDQKTQALGASEALEWAFLQYALATKTALPRIDTSGADLNAQARLNAELPPAGGSSANALGADQQKQAELASAYKHGNDSGDWLPFLNLRIPNPHPDITQR